VPKNPLSAAAPMMPPIKIGTTGLIITGARKKKITAPAAKPITMMTGATCR